MNIYAAIYYGEKIYSGIHKLTKIDEEYWWVPSKSPWEGYYLNSTLYTLRLNRMRKLVGDVYVFKFEEEDLLWKYMHG